MALLSGDGWLFLLRWFHFLAGITWIGMLYYFNFVQTPFFATAEAPVRTGMLATGLVSRALWWFRWGAMFTFITGWLYLLHRMGWVGPLTGSTKMGMLILMVVVIVVAEYNALVGTAGPGKKMLSTLKGTFWAGFVLTAIFWIVSVILTPRM